MNWPKTKSGIDSIWKWARRNFEFRDTKKHLLQDDKEKKVQEGEKVLSETWQSGETLVRI